MRAIQITVDEKLLRALDADEEVKRDGRSAVMRRAVAGYLERKRRGKIREAYERAYRDGGLGPDFEGWEEQGVWLDD